MTIAIQRVTGCNSDHTLARPLADSGPRRVMSATMLAISVSLPLQAAPVMTVLHEFHISGAQGAYPTYTGLLAQGRDGNLYGTTPQGGAHEGSGVAFKITPSGTFTKLHDFNRNIGDGYEPRGGLTLGSDGNFYGTSVYGRRNSDATAGNGNIFKMTPTGTITVLHEFRANGTEGRYPYAPPVQGRDGNFYGTTTSGGNGYGTIYRITPTGTFTVLNKLDWRKASNPIAPLILGQDGNFYGTAQDGGTLAAGSVGTVFKVTPAGAVSVVYNFDETHGKEPYSSVVQAVDGNFYGTTYGGGAFGNGTIFKLTPQRVITTLHSFGPTNSDGWDAWTGAVQATDGNLYGTTAGGGSDSDGGLLFKITPTGSYSVLYRFKATGQELSSPQSTPFLHTNGKIYGLTYSGSNGPGAVYSLAVGAPQFVRPVPDAAKAGASITLLGSMSGVTSVKFNGVAASFSGASGTYRRVVVPAGATTGPITVTKTGRTLSSNKPFIVLP